MAHICKTYLIKHHLNVFIFLLTDKFLTLHSIHIHEDTCFEGLMNSFQDLGLIINLVNYRKHWAIHLSCLKKVYYLYFMILYHSLVINTLNYSDLISFCQTMMLYFH
jgi:hypothetical protein